MGFGFVHAIRVSIERPFVKNNGGEVGNVGGVQLPKQD